MNKRLKYKLKAIFTPSCWFGNHRALYNKEWDDWLWNALETSDNIVVGHCSAKINGVEVWYANHPYASGYAYSAMPLKQCSRATAFLLIDTLKATYMIQRLKGPFDRLEFFRAHGISLPSSSTKID